ncbi:MAG: MerR family transcriptional regulator [Bacteroidota bacterium]
MKRYYTIGEVAEMLDVSTSLIRFWESEFDHLKPYKNSKGDRRFTPQNIDQLKEIYHLVRERGFTINGAKKEISSSNKRAKEKAVWMKRLKAIRTFLVELREEVGSEEEAKKE